MPHFEQLMPADLVGPNQKYWRAVTLSLEAPWFLLVHKAEYEGHKVLQTTLVAWESTLLDILTGIPMADCIGIARVEKERRPGSLWVVNWIESLWTPAPDEVQETGVLLLQLAGDPQVRDAQLVPVSSRDGRAIVFSASRPSATNNADAEVEPEEKAAAGLAELPLGAKAGATVPADFPSAVPAGVVPGAQAKLGVREEAGVFTSSGVEAHAERYAICLDLLSQLVEYSERKRVEKPDMAIGKLIPRVLAQLHEKRFGWGLSPAEADWISARLRARFFAR